MIMSPRILIVEDNKALAENLCEILLESAFEGDIVGTAEEAMARLSEQPYAAVITDLRLPGMSGIDLIEKLRGRGQAMPIVVITAFADRSMVEAAELRGALEVLPKPIDMGHFFEILEELRRSEPKVLVVEDSKALAENIAEALRLHDLEPIVAATVQAALAQRHLPEVAVIDLRLPDGSGLDAVRRLRARDPNLPVLVVTGYADDLASDEKDELPILEKPFPVAALVDRISLLRSKS